MKGRQADVSGAPEKLAPHAPSGMLLGQPLVFILCTGQTLLSSFWSGPIPAFWAHEMGAWRSPRSQHGVPLFQI